MRRSKESRRSDAKLNQMGGRRRLAQRRAAENDVFEQLTYLATESPAVAHRYAMALEHAYECIRNMPEIGFVRSYRAGDLRAVRVWPVPGFRRYLIFYRVMPALVEIVRVLHSARDVPRALHRT